MLIGAVITQAAVTVAFKQAENTHHYKLQKYMWDNFTMTSRGVLRDGKYHTLITSIFAHFDPMHLVFNTVAMYSFGMNTLAFLGPARFISLYLGGGLLSSLSFVAWPYVIPKSWPAYYYYNPNTHGLGASGAVNALVMWSILKEPFNKFLIMGVLPVPAVVCGLGMIGYDAYGLYDGKGNIANASHLTGAAFGALFYMFTRTLRRF